MDDTTTAVFRGDDQYLRLDCPDLSALAAGPLLRLVDDQGPLLVVSLRTLLGNEDNFR